MSKTCLYIQNVERIRLLHYFKVRRSLSIVQPFTSIRVGRCIRLLASTSLSPVMRPCQLKGGHTTEPNPIPPRARQFFRVYGQLRLAHVLCHLCQRHNRINCYPYLSTRSVCQFRSVGRHWIARLLMACPNSDTRERGLFSGIITSVNRYKLSSTLEHGKQAILSPPTVSKPHLYRGQPVLRGSQCNQHSSTPSSRKNAA